MQDNRQNRRIPAILSVDPGVNTGIAVLTVGPAPKLLSYSLFNFSKPRKGQYGTPTEHIHHTILEAGHQGVDIVSVVIENQYVAKNAYSAISLARCSGRWEEACQAVAWLNLSPSPPVSYVAASHWQKMELHGAMRGLRLSRAKLKRMAREVVEESFGVKVPTDAADAILLGRYHATRHRMPV